MDEFYSEDLNQDRSSCYAVSKGLVSTAPGTTVQPQNTEPKAPAISVNGARVDDPAGGLGQHQLEFANKCAISHWGFRMLQGIKLDLMITQHEVIGVGIGLGYSSFLVADTGYII